MPMRPKDRQNCHSRPKKDWAKKINAVAAMHRLMSSRESIRFMMRPANSMVMAPVAAMIEDARAICARLTDSSLPSVTKYSPGVLTIRPNPTNDRTQHPKKTSHGLHAACFCSDIRTSMFDITLRHTAELFGK